MINTIKVNIILAFEIQRANITYTQFKICTFEWRNLAAELDIANFRILKSSGGPYQLVFHGIVRFHTVALALALALALASAPALVGVVTSIVLNTMKLDPWENHVPSLTQKREKKTLKTRHKTSSFVCHSYPPPNQSITRRSKSLHSHPVEPTTAMPTVPALFLPQNLATGLAVHTLSSTFRTRATGRKPREIG